MGASIKNNLREGLLIVFSVLLALALSGLVSKWQMNKKKLVALDSIKTELNGNLAVIKEWEQEHVHIRADLQNMAYGQADSLKTEFRKYPFFNFGLLTGGKPLVNSFLSDTAWKTANSTGIVSELKFETVQLLAKAYTLQEAIGNKTLDNVLNFYYSSSAQDIENLDGTITQFLLRFFELTSQEKAIQELYTNALEHLETL